MVKVTLEVPEAVAELLKAMESNCSRRHRQRKSSRPWIRRTLKTIDAATDTLSSKRRLLQSYDTECERVRIDGRRRTPVAYRRTTQTLKGRSR